MKTIDYKERNIAVVNEQGELYPSIEALKEWEQWASNKAEQAMQGKLVSNDEVMSMIEKS